MYKRQEQIEPEDVRREIVDIDGEIGQTLQSLNAMLTELGLEGLQ